MLRAGPPGRLFESSMHPYKRSQRLGILLREEIADIVMRKVKDPRLGFVTVTDVELTEDLKIAHVYVTIMGEADTENTMSVLSTARGLIRSELSKRVRVKFIPNLDFRIDKAVERGRRVDELLKELEKGRQAPGSPSEVPEDRG